MILFVFSIIFAAVGLGWLALSGAPKDPADRRANRIGASTVLGIAAIFLLFASLVSIGTQTIGVKTTFGRPSATGITNGIHWKAPWSVVHRLDDAIQTDTYASNGYNGTTQDNADGGCINVRIARQATACVNVTLRWQIERDQAGSLYRNYKSNDNIKANLLHRDLQAAVNEAFVDYDPLGLDANGDSTQPTTTELAATVQDHLNAQVRPSLDVLKVFVPIFNFDPDTQQRLNQLQLQVAQTRIAEQARQTAVQQAKSNRALRRSVSNDPNVLVSKCLDILNEAVQKGQALPAGFSCFPGSHSAIAVKP